MQTEGCFLDTIVEILQKKKTGKNPQPHKKRGGTLKAGGTVLVLFPWDRHPNPPSK